jgi:hypothetical protein
VILACTCIGNEGVLHAAQFQDMTYGIGQRAHNPTTKEDMYRCTVCGSEHKKPGKTLSKKELKAAKEAEKEEKRKKAEEGARRK